MSSHLNTLHTQKGPSRERKYLWRPLNLSTVINPAAGETTEKERRPITELWAASVMKISGETQQSSRGYWWQQVKRACGGGVDCYLKPARRTFPNKGRSCWFIPTQPGIPSSILGGLFSWPPARGERRRRESSSISSFTAYFVSMATSEDYTSTQSFWKKKGIFSSVFRSTIPVRIGALKDPAKYIMTWFRSSWICYVSYSIF